MEIDAPNKPDRFERLDQEVLEFTTQRDWAQFHTAKNLVMALTGEVGELSEVFQWLTPEQSQNLTDDQKQKAAQEIADIQIYLIRLGQVLGVDVLDAVKTKMEKNAQKYPVDQARGRADKYTAYQSEDV